MTKAWSDRLVGYMHSSTSREWC